MEMSYHGNPTSAEMHKVMTKKQKKENKLDCLISAALLITEQCLLCCEMCFLLAHSNNPPETVCMSGTTCNILHVLQVMQRCFGLAKKHTHDISIINNTLVRNFRHRQGEHTEI